MKDFWVTGKRPSFAKVKFHMPEAMWQYIKQLKNRPKLKVTVANREFELWQTIEKPPEERKRASALTKVFKAVTAENKEVCYRSGVVWINDVRCITYDKEAKTLKIDKDACTKAQVANYDELEKICETE